ncbi:MAG: inorganic phosphate transporter [Bacteroidales bacterium]|nr:inorganic phosphate transporter [Bacteroidales bacterium]MBN2749327.1 inorganic phosphate transporter [Bacteroidales bacterium]
MENYYLIIVLVLMGLAVLDLVVGVSNDAVNFLNSAIGSKVAPRYIIMIIASIGIVIGATFSSGMMEVARKSIFHPDQFFLPELMMIFLAVMITDVLLLDIFNTFGLPTSTTVSLVFELLGAAVAISLIKISNNGESFANLSNYINSAKALAIISGILISVVVAFIAGSIVQYITRIIFTFQYERNYKFFGSIWGGIALTAITYFILMKGIEGSSLIKPEVMEYIKTHTSTILLYMFVLWTIIFQLCISILKWNTLRFIVLVGTFALALSFAGNDLVNFIGVFMAGLKSYQIHIANPGIPADQLLMTDLTKPVSTNFFYLMIAGLIMVITLWLSRKARTVTETELNLSRQDAGTERFGSTQFSRSVVRVFRNLSRDTEKILPTRINKFLDSRFVPTKGTSKKVADAPSFDLIRASVNLTVASILISSATSLKLPLSTTYVTFMVAMGSSLADKAWGRESAVYRITGVLTVIAGWFFTAFIAFTVAFLIAGILYYGGVFAVVIMILVAVTLIIKSYLTHKKKEQLKASERALEEIAMDDSLIQKCTLDVNKSLNDILRIYNQTVTGLTLEDRKLLKQLDRDVEDLNVEAKKLKYNVYSVLKGLQADTIETGHYYVQVIDYLREIAHSLTFVTGPSFEHIDNNHKGFTKSQNQELIEISNMISKLFELIMVMVKDNDYTAVPEAIKMQQAVLEMLNDARKKQIKRIKQNEAGTRNSVLYLAIINETKNIMLHTVNLLKAQRDFILNNVD